MQASARESQDLELASVLLDQYEDLSANQAKRLTMATQVNVLKLEKDLEMCVNVFIASARAWFLMIYVCIFRLGSAKSWAGCAG